MKRFLVLVLVLGLIAGSVAAAQAKSNSPKRLETMTTVGPHPELEKLTASDGTASDRFGISVAVSGDTAVVGAPHEAVDGRPQEGAAYVFTRVDGSWVEQAKLTASDGAAADRFGTAVGVFGDTVVVGSFFGDVGVNPDQGAAYVFTRTGKTWTEQAKLTASDGAAGDNFGFFVDVWEDTAIIGAYWDDVGTNIDQGSAYVFTRTGTTWTEQAHLTTSDGGMRDESGGRVALEGDTALVKGNATVHVFTRVKGTWTETAKLAASDGVDGDGFGSWVSLSANTAVIGAMSDANGANAEQGSAYVFTRAGRTWTEQAKLTASDGDAGDLFGRAVAVSGDTVVVGAQYDEVDSQVQQGSAYVFTRAGATWKEQAKLTASDGSASALFGVAVDMFGGTAAIGAGFHDEGENADQGAAYVWEDSPPPTVTRVSDGPDPFTPSGDTRRPTTISFTLSEEAAVTVKVFNRDGRLVRTLLSDKSLSGDRHSVRWNGRNTQGRVVRTGTYEYRIKAVDAAGNRGPVVTGTVRVR